MSAASALANKIGSTKPTAMLNSAAPRVELKQLTPDSFTDEAIGTVFETPTNLVTQLRALDMLQKRGGYQFFSQIASVMRKPSVELAEMITKNGSSSCRRAVIDGPPGSGKSVALLQMVTLALSKQWVVIAIPRAEELTDSSHSYAYDPERSTWRQDTYLAELLSRTASANKNVLQLLNTSKSYAFDRHSLPANSTLHKLLEIGAADPVVAQAVFESFLDELSLDGRPSVLIALDNMSIATLPTQYRDAELKAIHPFDLEILKWFTTYLNGTKTLKNGAVMASTSSIPACKPRALQIALNHSRPLPFEEVDPRIATAISGAKIVRVSSYTQAEISSVVQYYASAGIIKTSLAEVSESYAKQRSLMGGAIGREVFRSCLKM